MPLLTDLQASRRYPVVFGYWNDFWFGAPHSKEDRARVLEGVVASTLKAVEIENAGRGLLPDELDHLAAERVDKLIDDTIKHLTDKSVGLLQAFAFLVAAIALLMPGKDEPAIAVMIGHGTLIATVLTTILLFSNTRMAWRNIPGLETNIVRRLEENFAILVARAQRFRLAHSLAYICFAVVLTALAERTYEALSGLEFYELWRNSTLVWPFDAR